MQTDSRTPFSLPAFPRRRRAGAALVIILSCLVLITGIVVAFFASVSTELSAAKGYANGVTTKELSDTVVATVMGTIKTATTGTTGVCWASQPGMIRTFDIDSSATDPSYTQALACYKLYSSDTMVIDKGHMPFKTGTEINGNWKTQPGVYTDLNAPLVSGSNLIYPIIDPAMSGTIDGFTINPIPALGYSTSMAPGPTNNPAAMPAEWLYVLRNGDLAAPKPAADSSSGGGGGSGVSFAGSSVPTKSNPIVGRVAFWTDDETCKLNINTASEPTPWDTPRMVTSCLDPTKFPLDDCGNGYYQPFDGEYQRFPGHPAMTALSPVFFPGTKTLTLQQKTAIYNLVPRVQQGGSFSATVQTAKSLVTSPTSYNITTTGSSVVRDFDRLFPTVDEMLFTGTNRTQYNTANSGNQLNALTSATLAKLAPFLTANSRAPEVNLWGAPRISMWPVSSNGSMTYRTTYDDASAFCCTIGSGTAGRAFYFVRNPTTSQGAVGTGALSPTDDWTTNQRNPALYSYLQNLTGQDVPGFGGKFSAKWGTDRDQILTEIFDYIRCTNLRDPHVTTPYACGWKDSGGWVHGAGQVAPLHVGTTMGFGRFYTLSQFGIVLICSFDYSLLLASATNNLNPTPLHNLGFPFRSKQYGSSNTTWGDQKSWKYAYDNPPPGHSWHAFNENSAILYGGTTTVTGTDNYSTPPGNPYVYYINGGNRTTGGTVVLNAFIPRTHIPNQNYPTDFSYLSDQKALEAAFLMEPYCPSLGWTGITNDVYYGVTLNGFSISASFGPGATGSAAGGGPLFPTVAAATKYHPGSNTSVCHQRTWGGSAGVRSMLSPNPNDRPSGFYPFTSPLVTSTANLPLMISSTATGLTFNAATIAVSVYSGPDSGGNGVNAQQLVQTINASMPACSIPMPKLVTAGAEGWSNDGLSYSAPWSPIPSAAYWVGTGTVNHAVGLNVQQQPTGPGSQPIDVSHLERWNGVDPAMWWTLEDWGDWTQPDPDRGNLPTYFYGRITAAYYTYYPGIEYTLTNRQWTNGSYHGWGSAGGLWREEDVVRSVVPSHGDIRCIACMPTVSNSIWIPADPTYSDPTYQIVHIFSDTIGPQVCYNFANEPGAQVTGLNGPINRTATDTQLVNYDYHYSKLPEIASGVGQTQNNWNDWDNGPGEIRDGAYINKPDEGTIFFDNVMNAANIPQIPYYGWSETVAPGQILFSSNRIIPSSMMLGSLPTGVLATAAGGAGAGHAWQTLLFRPPTDRDGNSQGSQGSSGMSSKTLHPGWSSPRDHLIADLFWMPVVVPYPISEPFSTAGKVNMNYQIVPFNYIKRQTAMYGVLKGEMPLAISTKKTLSGASGNMSVAQIAKLYDHDTWVPQTLPNSTVPLINDASIRSNWTNLASGGMGAFRKTIDPVETLSQFDNVFDDASNPTIFKSATQICELHLVQDGETLAHYQSNFWSDYLATGDNTRERPYANLYARLTTKSNTYRIHMRVQALQQAVPPGSTDAKWTTWDETRDRVLGEYRGSALIERYIDAADPALASYDESQVNNCSLDPYYRFRVLNVKKLTP